MRRTQGGVRWIAKNRERAALLLRFLTDQAASSAEKFAAKNSQWSC
jgi:hypothetical protein